MKGDTQMGCQVLFLISNVLFSFDFIHDALFSAFSPTPPQLLIASDHFFKIVLCSGKVWTFSQPLSPLCVQRTRQ
jgi:hypothetical protein